MTPRLGSAPARAALGNVILIALLIVLAGWLFSLHAGDWQWRDPGLQRWLGVAVTLGLWLGFTAWLGWRRRRVGAAHTISTQTQGASILIVYASQTGTAEQLAKQTAQSLQTASTPVQLMDMQQLDMQTLRAAGRVLFVVSTTGEGDAPDSAARFTRLCMQETTDLAGLPYGLLALGDSDYDDFCGFGRQLQHWLQRCAAQPLFDPVEVDNGDPAALRHWHHHLALLSGASEMPDWQRPPYQRWQLLERRRLNPGSVGGPCFHLALKPLDGAPLSGDYAWQAGDLVEIGPRHATAQVATWLSQAGFDGDVSSTMDGVSTRLAELLAGSHLPAPAETRGKAIAHWAASLQALPHREYSIASMPADGALHLL
uniref:flavodoxin domain-containing protein n=1 Tax=Dyella silvatica TaxID=2992128 RepID=UPI0022598388